MPAVNNVLVVGAGLAGAGVAIHLASRGVAVDLIEIKPEVAALGSGITLQGNALRELRSLGVWDAVLSHGYAFDVTGFRAPDPTGSVLFEVPDAKTGGPDLPAVVGMPRPELAQILVDRATEVGV
jgi:2-polyprenyl-6-methoxyphenol hydroxylase-like FAD-dependent oxidoreductase